jgi:hypothetical protein
MRSTFGSLAAAVESNDALVVQLTAHHVRYSSSVACTIGLP